jgi:hypothetical protein
VTVKVDYWVVTYAYLVYKLLHVDWCQQNNDVSSTPLSSLTEHGSITTYLDTLALSEILIFQDTQSSLISNYSHHNIYHVRQAKCY